MRRVFAPCLIALIFTPPLWAQTAPAALSAESLQAIKAATVFIKTTTFRMEGSGSGFVIHTDDKTAWVVTNQHVVVTLGMRGNERIASSVQAVFNSGSAEEWSALCEVAALDAARD